MTQHLIHLFFSKLVPSGKKEQPSEVNDVNCSDIGSLLQSLIADLFLGLIEQEIVMTAKDNNIIILKGRFLDLNIHIIYTKKDVAKSFRYFTII
jgi:hypothetical protein